MLTLKTETIEDIKKALQLMGRLPRRQRVTVLSKAKSKLQAIRRSDGNSPELQSLSMKVARAYATEKRRLDDQKKKVQSFDIVDKRLYDLEVGEITPIREEGKYAGLQVGHDSKGFFAKGPSGRTKSYKWSGAIPDEELANLGDHQNLPRG